jgi:hypothetical protein
MGFKAGVWEVRPLLAAVGMPAARAPLAQAGHTTSAQLAAVTSAGGDRRPFVCASPPRAKWVTAPTGNFAADNEPYRAPEPLVIRSALTGEPYPPPDRTPAIFDDASARRRQGPDSHPRRL